VKTSQQRCNLTNCTTASCSNGTMAKIISCGAEWKQWHPA